MDSCNQNLDNVFAPPTATATATATATGTTTEKDKFTASSWTERTLEPQCLWDDGENFSTLMSKLETTNPTLTDRRQPASHPQQQCEDDETIPSSSGSIPNHPQFRDMKIAPKYLSPDYYIRNAEIVEKPRVSDSLAPKEAQPTFDMRMQEVMQPFRERAGPCKTETKPTSLLNPIRSLVMTSDDDEDEHSDAMSYEAISLHAGIYRAVFKPPDAFSDEPEPQFEPVCFGIPQPTECVVPRSEAIPAKQLDIPRLPLHCPDTMCRRMVFVSDFCKHFIVDHSRLPFERIAPNECKNFFLDPRLARHGHNRCHLVYYIRDKIRDLGTSEYKDLLPMLVMSTRINLSELCSGNAYVQQEPCERDDYVMVWLTGLVPEDLTIPLCLAIWSRWNGGPKCHVISSVLYSVRASQDPVDIYKSGGMLLLPMKEIEVLTCGYKEMLEFQVCVK